MKTVIEMAREAAAVHGHTFKAVPSPETIEFITAFAELARADERKATLDEIAKWLEVEKDAPYWAELVRARSNT